MPTKVVEVQVTPNPNARKFILSGRVSERAISFFNPNAAEGHGLGEALFGVAGVTSVLILGDFITVNKDATAKWPDVVSGVKRAIEGPPPGTEGLVK